MARLELEPEDLQRAVTVDRERIAMAETGHTTAHLQTSIDTPLSTLIERFVSGLGGIAGDAPAQSAFRCPRSRAICAWNTTWSRRSPRG